MADRAFRLHDTSLMITANSGKKDTRPWSTWDAPDWETFNCVLDVLKAIGFSVGRDPRIEKDFAILGPRHRAGRWDALEYEAETHQTGCKFEFFQNVVHENPNGGKYDFSRRAKMPYLVGKRFELAVKSIRDHLIARGFTEEKRIDSASPDPLAYFNDTWDGEYERKRGMHRFKRGEDGWPLKSELNARANCDADGREFWHGDVLYTRTEAGHLRRGRVYGGINGRWIMVYGPGNRDFTHYSHWELFSEQSPRMAGRKVHPRGEKRLQQYVEALRGSLAKLTAANDFVAAQNVVQRLAGIARARDVANG